MHPEINKTRLKSTWYITYNFSSETEIVNNDMVNKAVNKLKDKRYVIEGFLKRQR